MAKAENRFDRTHPSLCAPTVPKVWFLYLTAFVSGAIIMVVEIVGARALAPLFGVGLFVWTAQIAVAMVALAGGYVAGGRVVDRFANPDAVFWMIAGAGLSLLAVAPAKEGVLKWGLDFGLRGGSIVSAAALFGLPLFLLGCVSPGVIRLVTRRLDRVGGAAGGVYALSTVGSVLGTVLTGFFLVGLWGVSRILAASGALLLGLASVHFFLTRRPLLGAILIGAGAVGLIVSPGGASAGISRKLPSGTTATLVYARPSPYGEIRVLDYTYGALAVREFTLDGLIQGGMDRSSRLPTYEYLYLLACVPTAVRPGGKRALLLGLGAGLVPSLLERQGVKTDVVEIDPAVLEVAERFFGFRPAARVFVEDARVHLARSTTRYDYVLIDVFNGDGIPFHMVTLEAFRAAKRRLLPGGVLALNAHGKMDLSMGGVAAVTRTLLEVFENVDLYPAFQPAPSAHGNVIIAAYDGPPAFAGAGSLARISVHPLARRGLAGFWIRRVSARRGAVSGPVLTDDLNGVDLMDLELREAVRMRLLQDTPWDLLVD